ncbi:hypothetical protein ACFW9M_03325 [Streptomyces lydicus]|uniref:hypothetical protein n=1 Tax=Streptomyces lydicus TaxID=47763 RepID=UPI0009813698|nr:hypothetical protein [Streptomyces lydicus]
MQVRQVCTDHLVQREVQRVLGVGKGVDGARGQCTRQVVQRDEGRVETDVLRLQCIGSPRRPLPQELVNEGVFMVGVFAQLLVKARQRSAWSAAVPGREMSAAPSSTARANRRARCPM